MKYGRTFNFSAGPAMMPEPVLEEIRDEMMNYRGSGMCVMEMSHRSKVFQQIIDEADADLRDLARERGWEIRDFRTARKAARIGVPSALALGAVGGALAAVVSRRDAK